MVLKHLTTSGHIQEWYKQRQLILAYCKCTEAVFRSRIAMLCKMKLMQRYKLHRKNDCLRLFSWDNLGTCLDINLRKSGNLTFQYTTNDKQKPHEWIIASEIKEAQSRQDYTIIAKLKKNPETMSAVIAAILSMGADRSRLTDDQYLLTWLRIAYRNDFIDGSDIHEALIHIRPDNNRGVKKIADDWKCKHPVTVSYWKNLLAKNRIIDVSKLQIQSNSRMRNKACCVLWLPNSKQTLLCLCDQITVLCGAARVPIEGISAAA